MVRMSLIACAVLVAAAGVAHAAPTPDGKRCIFEAAKRLGSIPGLAISSSSADEMSSEEQKKMQIEPPGDAHMLLITIAASAAGQSAVFRFMCAYNENGLVVKEIDVK